VTTGPGIPAARPASGRHWVGRWLADRARSSPAATAIECGDRRVSYAELHGITEDEVLETVLLRESAIKRLVEPDDAAAMVGYLCGPAAGFATGTSVVMDGGWTAR
jgi:NAD(P)-dependent dehydrogenase (short-subunit alcohol dehydrogenase family)